MRNELLAGVYSPEIDEHVVYPVGFGCWWRRLECHHWNWGQRLGENAMIQNTQRRRPLVLTNISLT